MKMLFLNLLRDIRRTIGQFISILLVLTVGCFFFAGMTEASSAIDRQVGRFYKEQNFADSTGYFMYLNSLAVNEIAGKQGVTYAEGRNTFYTDTLLGGNKHDLIVTTLTEHVNLPYLYSGNMPTEPGECLVDREFADAQGIKPGDSLLFDIDMVNTFRLAFAEEREPARLVEYTPATYSFTVSGIYHSPELIYKVNVKDVAKKGADFGVLLVPYESVPLFAEGAQVIINDFLTYTIDTELDIFTEIVTDSTADTEELFKRYTIENIEQLQNIFENQNTVSAGLYMFTQPRSAHPSETAFRATFDQMQNLISVVPMIFFAVAAAITFISLSKTVDNQRTQIGIMQAIGITKGSIYLTYLLYAALAAVLGALIGGFAGTYSFPFIYSFVFKMQYNMPPLPLSVNPSLVLGGLAIALAVALLSAFTSCHRTLKEIPASALRPRPPKKTKKILLERWNGLWKRLGFGAKIILRNIFLHKTRIFLSSIGVIGCLTLLIGGIGIKDRVSYILKHFERSAAYDLQLTLTETNDISLLDFDEIFGYDDTDNAKTVTFTPKLNGRVSFGGDRRDMSLVALPSDKSLADFPRSSDTCVRLYRDYEGTDLLRFAADTFAIPHKLAEELKIHAGDEVSITAYTEDNQNVTATVTVTDIVRQYADQSVYASYEVFQACGFGLYANSLYVNVQDTARVEETKASIAQNEHVSGVYTASELQQNLLSGVSILDSVVGIIVAGAAVLAIAVIYNITAINVFERTREIATLMVLGYKKFETNRLIMVENMVVTALGCILGIPVGFGLLTWLISIVSSMNISLPGNLTPLVVLICVGLTFTFSVIATLLLERKLQKISMVEALKSVE